MRSHHSSQMFVLRTSSDRLGGGVRIVSIGNTLGHPCPFWRV